MIMSQRPERFLSRIRVTIVLLIRAQSGHHVRVSRGSLNMRSGRKMVREPYPIPPAWSTRIVFHDVLIVKRRRRVTRDHQTNNSNDNGHRTPPIPRGVRDTGLLAETGIPPQFQGSQPPKVTPE